MRTTLFRGRDHLRLGAVEAVAEGTAAVAISLGGAAKAYEHTDPNEDAALFAIGTHGILVAVADGHAGFGASEAALERLRAEHAPAWTGPQTPRAATWRELALEAFADANQAILGHTTDPARTGARTTLALALIQPERELVLSASIGDSHVFCVRSEECIDLAAAGRRCEPWHFLGRNPKTGDEIAQRAVIEVVPLADAHAIVLATDGLSEHRVGVEDPEAEVAEVTRRARETEPELRPLQIARGVAEAACAAHRRNPSGDNVAVAVWSKGSE